MTVQELIDKLNNVEDKSKIVRFDLAIEIDGFKEGDYFVDIY